MTTRYTTSSRFEISADWNKACGRPAVPTVHEVLYVEEYSWARFQFVTLKDTDGSPRVVMSGRGRFVGA